ncbi:MAG: phenylalanine--tRNA ligase subunit beta, partial [Gammaproteobacteria bacterium]|nr:phenylalanine--tRNA ligase subunit beta [Gammaproteobacteria bacterium]
TKIKAAKIRGVRSEGMLCSAKELALADDAAGLLVLDANASVGTPLREHLRLDDAVIDIDLTANRGDCFSVLGIAREVAARTGAGPLDEALDCVEPSIEATHDVALEDTAACPRFAGRVIATLSAGATTPDWLKERLRRSGLRPIHPVVDVTNYVMLEFGQPLHAYRLDKLAGPIRVRFAARSEKLTLLDGSELELDTDALVIADDSGAIGLAGIMGGLSTAVDAETTAIFLESAFFSPSAIQGRARRYGLHTDASVRFERGVDPSGQERAIERATALLGEIAGGQPGPIVVAEDPDAIPVRRPIALSPERIAAVLGTDIGNDLATELLQRLGMEVETVADGFVVTPPSYRFDIVIEEDLIEEIGRMVGYDAIPVTAGHGEVHLGTAPESQVTPERIADLLAARGFNEVVTYAFTEEHGQRAIAGDGPDVRLANPISQELNVMRRSLWPGLIRVARLNQSHQQLRGRYFEIGTVFAAEGTDVAETTRVAGLVIGARHPEHWEATSAESDYFDLKGDVEALLWLWRDAGRVSFVAAEHRALNPAKTAAIHYGDTRIGWIGALHPRLQNDYELKSTPVLFEFDLNAMPNAALPRAVEYSKYPTVRRDLAVIVDDAVPVAKLTKLVDETLGPALARRQVFDLYRGKGVDSGRKSVGIGLILQNASRTLTDDEADDMIHQVVRRLEHELGARIRN